MPYDRFMIAPIQTGLQTDIRPWLIPDDAFEELNNAYVWRGRIRKRFGSILMGPDQTPQQSRLRIALPGGAGVGITNGVGGAAGTVPGTVFAVGQMFSIGTQLFTVPALGAPVVMLNTGAGVGTFNTTTGAYTFAGVTALTQIYFYPATPVMGIITYETAPVNDEPVYAFDTQFAYFFTGTGWERLGTGIWTGNDAQFFTGSTWRGNQNFDDILFVTNFNPPDGIQYWDGAAWATLNPVINNAGDTLETARIIVPFKDRLVALNTVENITGTNRSFPNRARFSQNGTPLVTTDVNSWNEDVPGKGDFLDASTKEAIITAEFLKDRLIVFFERSTWELVYTGNEVLPFRWQKINTELGAESTLSVVPFDKVILGVGNVGIHACNGANVERIDEKIPDSVFDIHNEQEGVFRVAGIRDYFVEMVYWTFPGTDPNAKFPNRILVYNYRTGSWAFNDDSITAFGYYQNTTDATWASTPTPWFLAEEIWNTGFLISKFRQVLAGNQEGFMFIISPDNGRNAPALQITQLTFVLRQVTLTIINHNLTTADFIALENIQGVNNLNGNIYQVQNVIDANTIQIQVPSLSPAPTGVYLGGGTAARVSQIDIFTKQYNFYVDKGRNANVYKVDFYVDATQNGQINIYIYPSTSNLAVQALTLETKPYQLITLEASNALTQLWHPVYPQAEGETVQLRIFLDPTQSVDPADPLNPLTQMTDPLVAWSDFELHAMTFYCKPSSYRLE